MKAFAWLLAMLVGSAFGDDARRSGFDSMSPATQAMQRDDAQNPAMLWVQDGEALWTTAAGTAKRSCASCHGDAAKSMRGVAARHPAFDEASKSAITLSQRIVRCRTQHQGAAPFAPESHDLLALESYVAMQSRAMPIAPPRDTRLDAERERGRLLFSTRMGQLDLACAQCHDERAGERLGGNVIPQGHPTGYPIYRLEWQSLGSLQRRLRNCMYGVRAEPFAFDSAELTALELYLMQRAAGMKIETPAVRP